MPDPKTEILSPNDLTVLGSKDAVLSPVVPWLKSELEHLYSLQEST